MTAFIRCVLHLNDIEVQALQADEDAWHKAWGQVKFYLETVNQVKFS